MHNVVVAVMSEIGVVGCDAAWHSYYYPIESTFHKSGNGQVLDRLEMPRICRSCFRLN